MLLEVQVGLSAVPVSAVFIQGRPFPTGCWLFHVEWQHSASLTSHFVPASLGAQGVLMGAGML